MTDKPRQNFKFLSEDTGYVRTYYRGLEDRALYCFQPVSHASEWPPSYEFLVCTSEGEPSHTVLTPMKYRCQPFLLPKWGREPQGQ